MELVGNDKKNNNIIYIIIAIVLIILAFAIGYLIGNNLNKEPSKTTTGDKEPLENNNTNNNLIYLIQKRLLKQP